MGDEPPVAHRDQPVPVPAHVVRADLGEDREVARDRGFGRSHALEADVGHVVADHLPGRTRLLFPGGLARLLGCTATAEAFHDRRATLDRLAAAYLEDTVHTERSRELLEQVPVARMRVLRQRVPAALACNELPDLHRFDAPLVHDDRTSVRPRLVDGMIPGRPLCRCDVPRHTTTPRPP